MKILYVIPAKEFVSYSYELFLVQMSVIYLINYTSILFLETNF